MSRRWTPDEDQFIVAYYDAVGVMIGPHDLGRTEKAVEKRARFLKDSGAWGAWELSQEYREKAIILSNTSGGPQHDL
jgi:hypothetical protein